MQGNTDVNSAMDALKAFKQVQPSSSGGNRPSLDEIFGTHTSTNINPHVSQVPQSSVPKTNAQMAAERDKPITDFFGNLGSGILGGVKQMVGGLKQAGQSGSDFTDMVRGTKSDVTGKVPNAGDVASNFVQGTSNTLAGAEGAGFAPLSAGVEALPDIAKVPIKGVMSLPGQTVGAGVEGIGHLLGVDPKDPKFQENFVKPAQTLLNTFMATNPELVAKATSAATGAIGGFAGDMISEVKNADAVNSFKSSFPEEMQGKFDNQPTSQIAKSPEFKDWQAQQKVAVPETPTPTTTPEPVQPKVDPQEIKNNLLRAGYDEKTANAASQRSPEHQAILNDYIKTGQAQIADPDNVNLPNVWKKPAGEIENFITKAQQHLDDIGQKQGDAAAKLPDNVRPDPTKIENVLNEHLSKLNIKNTPDGLDFNSSHIAGAGEAQGIIQKIANTIEDPNATAKDYEALTSQIDDATGALSRRGVTNSKANTALTQLKTAINSTVGDISPEFQTHNTNYAKLVKDLNLVKDATKVSISGGENYDGTQLLKRILGDAPGKYQEALDAMNRIQKNFGIEAPKDIGLKAKLANEAEKITGSNQSRNLKGQVQSGVQAGVEHATGQVKTALLDLVPGGKALEKMLDAHDLYSHPERMETFKNQSQTFLDMMEEANKTKNAAGDASGVPSKITPENVNMIQRIIKKMKNVDPAMADKLAKSLATATALSGKKTLQNT